MQTEGNLAIDPKAAISYGVAWVRGFFRKNGFSKGVIGVSGGCDSALTAYITARAIGKGNVIGLMLPEDGVTTKEDTEHARALIRELGIRGRYTNITKMLKPIVEEDRGLLLERNRVPYANVKSRLRMLLLYKAANESGGLVVGTDDRSEHIIGYYTKYGDGGVDLNVPEYLYKTQVRDTLRYIAKREKMAVMAEIADKRPSPRLWAGQHAEDEIGIDYGTIDAVLYLMNDAKPVLTAGQAAKKLQVDEGIIRKIERLEKINRHKRELPPAPHVNYSLFTHR